MAIRSFNRVNPRGRTPQGGNCDSPAATGKNSGPTRLGSGGRYGQDASSGRQRQRTPKRLG